MEDCVSQTARESAYFYFPKLTLSLPLSFKDNLTLCLLTRQNVVWKEIMGYLVTQSTTTDCIKQIEAPKTWCWRRTIVWRAMWSHEPKRKGLGHMCRIMSHDLLLLNLSGDIKQLVGNFLNKDRRSESLVLPQGQVSLSSELSPKSSSKRVTERCFYSAWLALTTKCFNRVYCMFIHEAAGNKTLSQ